MCRLEAGPESENLMALASYENRLSGIETRLAVLTWMVGFNLVMTAGTLWHVFTH